MPKIEAIADTLIPKPVEKPIPTQVVQTRSIVKPEPQRDQLITDKAPSTAAESAPPAESVKLSPQLSAIARKEQEFRKKSQALEEREKSLEAKLLDADKFLKLQEKLKSKDFSSLEEIGLDYEGYTNYLLNKQQGQDPQKAEMQKLADEMASLKKSQEEKEKEELETTLREYRREIKSLVEKDPQFSSVKELERGEVALQLILDSWEEDGEELTIEQALKEVEDFSVDEAKKFSQLSKLRSQEPKEEPKAEEKRPLPKPSLKTLTNQVNVQAPDQMPKKSLQHMSDAERLEEARRRVMARKQNNG